MKKEQIEYLKKEIYDLATKFSIEEIKQELQKIDSILVKYQDSDRVTDIDRGSSQLGSNRSARMQQEQATSYVSYGVTEYRIFNDDGYLAESRIPYEPKDSIGKKIQELLKKYGAYDFVDKGFLGGSLAV